MTINSEMIRYYVEGKVARKKPGLNCWKPELSERRCRNLIGLKPHDHMLNLLCEYPVAAVYVNCIYTYTVNVRFKVFPYSSYFNVLCIDCDEGHKPIHNGLTLKLSPILQCYWNDDSVKTAFPLCASWK